MIVALFGISCSLAGCDDGGGGATTASPDETKAAVKSALEKARAGPTGKGGAPAADKKK
jgi:hypothetical protein